ncbi:MAG: Flp family type IVb pilin [Vicinamibacterales bacterium]
MANLIARLRWLARGDEGQDLIEYALIASLIAVAMIVVVGEAGTEVNILWNNIATALKGIP